MLRITLFLLLSISLFSCRDTVCDCVEAGDRVNKISASFFDRKYSVEGKDSLNRAIENRDEICEPFKEMSAQQLQEAASECKNLLINPS